MDHTIVLIQKSHEGDKEARARLVEENTGLVCCKAVLQSGCGNGGSVSDWNYWSAESD